MQGELARIEVIFAEAVTKAGEAERAAYLDKSCGGDTELRQRVEALLAAHTSAGSFLKLPSGNELTLPFVPLSERPGSTIGRFKLLEQIGEGGFGVVFMAEQEEPVRRLVALKIIKLGMDTRQVVARFEAERQALAMMDHPNVARVLDGGATDTGRPYFVMELVKGVPITEYCNKNNLSIAQRLELFCQVCQAVQHAHQKGLIHRDIKPTNVLVMTQDDRAVAKVIDFGVAKAMQARLTEKTLFTEFRQLVGTPAYMSPEQAAGGLDIDTRSDVYSLGVLLYELLVGSPPFDPRELRSKAFAEMQRIICEVEPPTPSTRLTRLTDNLPSVAAQRSIAPKKLAAAVQGELDWIVMRCLEKDRRRRYQSASNLAEDLDRYLTDKPVEARPAGRIYRLRKFIRRNKAGVFAGTAIVAALLIGAILSSIGFIQARRQEEIARTQAARSDQVAQFLKEMLEGAGPAVTRGRDAALLREILDRTAERVEKSLEDQPEVQGDLWFTLGNTYSDIGDTRRAVEMHRRAVDSYRTSLGDSNPKLALALGYLGRSQSRIAEISTGNANARTALEMARKCDDSETLAACLFNMGKSFDHSGIVPPEAVPYLRECVALRRQLPNNPVSLAQALGGLADALSYTDNAETEALSREALALHRQHLGNDHPYTIDDLQRLGNTLMWGGRPADATPVLREAVELSRKVLDKDDARQYLTLYVLANALRRQEKWDEAEAVAREAVEAYPDLSGYQGLLGSIKACRGDWPAAVENFSRGVELNPGYFAVVGRLGISLLKTRRDDEYHELRKTYLAELTYDGECATEHCFWFFSMLMLEPAEGDDLEKLSRLGESATRSNGMPRTETWKDVLRAQTEYRRGNFNAACEAADRFLAKPDITPRAAQAWFIRAMACVEMRQTGAAAEAFSKGDALMAATDWRKVDLWQWPDWAIAELLCEQAFELISQRPLDNASTPRPALQTSSVLLNPDALLTQEALLKHLCRVGAPTAQFDELLETSARELQKIKAEKGDQHADTTAATLALCRLSFAARKMEEAAMLLNELPAELIAANAKTIAPMLQAIAFSSGGAKKWQRSADFYERLIFGPANAGMTQKHNDVAMLGLEYASVLAELDDRDRHERLREFLMGAYRDTTAIAVAERSLTACLLFPASERQMTTYEKWAKIAASTSSKSRYSCWDYAVLSLFEHRRGDHAAALAWGQKCLGANPPPACLERAHILIAIALSQLSRPEEAQAELAKCRNLIESKFAGSLGEGIYETGLWKDWLIDRALLREADRLLAELTAAPQP